MALASSMVNYPFTNSGITLTPLLPNSRHSPLRSSQGKYQLPSLKILVLHNQTLGMQVLFEYQYQKRSIIVRRLWFVSYLSTFTSQERSQWLRSETNHHCYIASSNKYARTWIPISRIVESRHFRKLLKMTFHSHSVSHKTTCIL